MRTLTKFPGDRRTAAEMWGFLIFQHGGRRHREFLNFWNFNSWNAQEGETVSLYQILSKSVKLRPRYCDFSIFQDGGRRNLGFSKFQNFNHLWAQEAWTASLCQIWSKSIEPLRRYDDFSIFPRWLPSAILDLLCEWFDNSRRAFGSLYHCAKFGWNRCSSFDNMHVFRFREFGLKTPIHAPKIGVLGDITH